MARSADGRAPGDTVGRSSMFAAGVTLMLRLIAGTGLAATIACGPSVQALYPRPEVPRRPDEIEPSRAPSRRSTRPRFLAEARSSTCSLAVHVVRVMEYLGDMNLEGTGGWTAHLAPIVYALQAEAGHAYSITLDARGGTGHFVELSIKALDRGPDGTATRVAPTADPMAVRASALRPVVRSCSPPSERRQALAGDGGIRHFLLATCNRLRLAVVGQSTSPGGDHGDE